MTRTSASAEDVSLNLVDTIARPAPLRDAWFRVRSAGGAPGIDGLSVDVFKRNPDAHLDRLQSLLATREYAVSPLRRVRIPKASGGWRLLAIPTVLDRIVQTACAVALQNHLSPTFSDRSFAYRPFLGPRRAGARLVDVLRGASHVITADIEKFFDNVEHRLVTQQLSRAGVDEEGIRLVLRWLRAPIADGPTRLHPLKGLPQGAPVSPVLANLYLTGFDRMIEASGHEHVRYADDFIVLARSAEDAETTLHAMEQYLHEQLALALKPQKTQYATAREGFAFVGFWLTDSSWTAPESSVEEFRVRVAGLLKDHRREFVMEVAKRHNDMVRGWRNYYGGNSPEMDRQLEDLEGWRLAACAAYYRSAGADAVLGRSMFDVLTDAPAATAPAGAYSSDDWTHRGDDASPWPAGDPWRTGDASALSPVIQSHSSTRQLRAGAFASRQPPAILTGRLLRIPTYGAFVTRTQSLLAVRRKKQTVFECPFADLSHISVESEGVCLSTRVLDECARRRISITVSRTSGVPIARIVPARSELKPDLADHQITARLTTDGMVIAKAIICAKVANQRALLLYHAKYTGRADETRAALKRAAMGLADLRKRAGALEGLLSRGRTNLFLTEARAAALYWSAFAEALPAGLGFRRRRGRGADDLVNKLLNFGYWSLHLRVRNAIEHAGLHPSLGLLHTSRRQTPGLVFDAMEEFRQPLVDRVVLSLVGRGSRLELNHSGGLASHTRTLAQRAFARALERQTEGRVAMLHVIHEQARALARSIATGSPYAPYQYIW